MNTSAVPPKQALTLFFMGRGFALADQAGLEHFEARFISPQIPWLEEQAQWLRRRTAAPVSFCRWIAAGLPRIESKPGIVA